MRKKERPAEGKRLEPSVVLEFERAEVQLESFYDEISILSKKKPDEVVNKFKLTFINQTVTKVNALLGDSYRPFLDFQTFDEVTLPTTSDVVMMLSQYLASMDRYRRDHTYYDDIEFTTLWWVKGKESMQARQPKKFDQKH